MPANQKSDGKITSISVELKTIQSDPQAVANYIGDISLGLRELAEQSDLTFLAYLLDLVYEESTIITRNKTNKAS